LAFAGTNRFSLHPANKNAEGNKQHRQKTLLETDKCNSSAKCKTVHSVVLVMLCNAVV